MKKLIDLSAQYLDGLISTHEYQEAMILALAGLTTDPAEPWDEIAKLIATRLPLED